MEINIKLEEGKIYKLICGTKADSGVRYRLSGGELESRFINCKGWERSSLDVSSLLGGWQFAEVVEPPKEYTLAELEKMESPKPIKIKSAITNDINFLKKDGFTDNKAWICNGMYIDEALGKWTIVED